MATNKKSMRIMALLATTQLIAGTPQALDPVNDLIIAENIQPTFDPQTIRSQESTGTLDDNEGTEVTGIKGGCTVEINVAGEGAAGTELRYSRLLQACGWQQQLTPAAIGATNCQAGGTTTTVVLDAGASSVDEYYRGLPIELSGDFTDQSVIVAYDGTTKTATVASTLSQAPGVATTYTIPANVMFRPGSGDIPALTMAVYYDDQEWTFEGCRGNVVPVFEAGGLVKLRFTFQGNYVARIEEPAPTGSYSRMDKIKFLKGRALLDRNAVAVSNITLDPQSTLAYDPNPNRDQGYDAPEITGRDMQVTIDPNLVGVATRDTLARMQASDEFIVYAQAGRAADAGNRIAMVVPRAMPSGYNTGDRQSVAIENITATCKGADSGAFICVF